MGHPDIRHPGFSGKLQDQYPGRGGNQPVMIEETVNYRIGTNVLCKACKDQKIFVSGPIPTKVSDPGGLRYLVLKCPSPACGQVKTYEENELEIH
jgi:hypothetical protein